jgi:hypothetical protein
MEFYGYCKGHTGNISLSKNANVTEQSLITKQLEHQIKQKHMHSNNMQTTYCSL